MNDLMSKLSLLAHANINSWLQQVTDPATDLHAKIEQLGAALKEGEQQLAVSSSQLATYEEQELIVQNQLDTHTMMAQVAGSTEAGLQQAAKVLELEEKLQPLQKEVSGYRATHQRLEATVAALRERLSFLIIAQDRVRNLESTHDQLAALAEVGTAEQQAEEAEESALKNLDRVETRLQLDGIEVPQATNIADPRVAARLAQILKGEDQ